MDHSAHTPVGPGFQQGGADGAGAAQFDIDPQVEEAGQDGDLVAGFRINLDRGQGRLGPEGGGVRPNDALVFQI